MGFETENSSKELGQTHPTNAVLILEPGLRRLDQRHDASLTPRQLGEIPGQEPLDQRITCKLAEGAPCPIILVLNEDVL